MQFSNTKEDGLETIIVDWLVKHNGYEQGTNADYNKEYAIDETRLSASLLTLSRMRWKSWQSLRVSRKREHS